jgi:hypothetical protein
MLWKAVGWKGTFDLPVKAKNKPSSSDFIDHFNKLLNPNEETSADLNIPTSGVYVPVLDEEIKPGEVDDVIQKFKSSKSAGIDGIPPGVLKWLTDEWILLLTFIMNTVFFGAYPSEWTKSKIFVIHKKGPVCDPGNYRGISVMNVLPKLYDSILNKRLSLWYKPCVEQAGAQAGRGCEEQLLTLRLYIDLARKKRYVLYVIFIDYIKAYDKVNRQKLLQMLADLGCGDTFLKAIGNSIKLSISWVQNLSNQQQE